MDVRRVAVQVAEAPLSATSSSAVQRGYRSVIVVIIAVVVVTTIIATQIVRNYGSRRTKNRRSRKTGKELG